MHCCVLSDWARHARHVGQGEPEVPHDKNVLNFECNARAEKPSKRTLQKGWGRVGDAFARDNKAFSWRSRAFPALASLSPPSHYRLWRASPRHCLHGGFL